MRCFGVIFGWGFGEILVVRQCCFAGEGEEREVGLPEFMNVVSSQRGRVRVGRRPGGVVVVLEVVLRLAVVGVLRRLWCCFRRRGAEERRREGRIIGRRERVAVGRLVSEREIERRVEVDGVSPVGGSGVRR
ncbi:hypothetical protein HAX54_052999 [Datura stramonium]|uniref:Uncharacterized protein n=1 Tax=Datura stramonium TaxID=4076 RepID=A0ABS8WRE7_DATST|nr:hypothetical protein [Datura stramonium]